MTQRLRSPGPAAALDQADVLVVHADAIDLARLFTPRALRPLLLVADHPESVKHAYAALKLLARRCGWLSAELLLVASASSPRLPHIAETLRRCAEVFVGAAITGWAAVDPGASPDAPADAALARLAAAQLQADPDPARTEFAVPWPDLHASGAAAPHAPAWRGH